MLSRVDDESDADRTALLRAKLVVREPSVHVDDEQLHGNR